MSQDLFRLDGRIALVTGASRGIGFVLARGLAEFGATVVVNGRNTRQLEAARDTLARAGHKAHTASFDVTNRSAAAAAIDQVEAQVGPIDILINNAGMQARGRLEDYPEETWRELMTTNLDGVFFVSQAVARHMIGRKRGKIINLCSVQSELGRATIAPYAASKGAVKMLTKGMCVDWGPHGIQVNGLGPGYFQTELNRNLANDDSFDRWLRSRVPSGRWGDVDELIGAAVFLASDASSYVNGHVLYVDGGITSSL